MQNQISQNIDNQEHNEITQQDQKSNLLLAEAELNILGISGIEAAYQETPKQQAASFFNDTFS